MDGITEVVGGGGGRRPRALTALSPCRPWQFATTSLNLLHFTVAMMSRTKTNTSNPNHSAKREYHTLSFEPLKFARAQTQIEFLTREESLLPNTLQPNKKNQTLIHSADHSKISISPVQEPDFYF